MSYADENEVNRIRLRCVECEGCWLWSGSRTRQSLPTVARLVGDKKQTISARRWMYLAANGGALTAKQGVETTCGEPLCLNPAHLKKVSRSKLVAGTWRQPDVRAARSAASAKSWDGRRKLNMAQVSEIRGTDTPSKQLADQLGVTSAHINYIRRGEAYRDRTNPFAGLMR